MQVIVSDTIERLPRAAWQHVVERAGAPVFYGYDFLRAYERSPLSDTRGTLYVLVRHGRAPRAAIPAYLLDDWDPLGVLSGLVPADEPARRMLVSHMWHCYDSRLPVADSDDRLVDRVCAELSRVARELDAAGLVFANVTVGSLLLEQLRALGFRIAPIEVRYVLDLRDLRGPDDYLAALPGRVRRALLRHRRRGGEAGVRISITAAQPESLDDALELCRRTAARHGNDAYYQSERMRAFLTGLGARSVRIVRVELEGDLVAASICLLDDTSFHTWAGGADYARCSAHAFSPNYVLFYEEVRAALGSGRARLEAGRRNHEFKLRHGLAPVGLCAATRATDGR